MAFIRNRNIFQKLLFTFLIAILPLYSLSLVLNELAKKEVKGQISQSVFSQTEFFFQSFEQELERITKLLNENIYDQDLVKISSFATYMTDYEKTEAINRILNRIGLLSNSSKYIQNVTAYIPLIERTLSTTGSVSETSPESLKYLNRLSRKQIVNGAEGNLFINVSYPSLPANDSEHTPLFILNMNLSKEEIQRGLRKINANAGAVLVNKEWEINNGRDVETINAVKQMTDVGQIDAGRIYADSRDIAGNRYFIAYEKSALLDATLFVYLPEDIILGKLRTYNNWFWLLSGISLVIVLMFSLGIRRVIQSPLKVLLKAFRSLEEGNMKVAIRHKNNDEFGYLFKQFDKTVRNLDQLINELYVQKLRLHKAELKQLQSQINPHFLYNNFFTLHHLIAAGDSENGLKLSAHMGDYFKYITRNFEDEVPLDKEYEHARAYVEIQQNRFSKRIQVEFDPLPSQWEERRIPRLIFQPILENAYEHGLHDVIRGGRLRFGLEPTAAGLRIFVEDNGAGMTPEQLSLLQQHLTHNEEGESTGLINIHRRLVLKYGEMAGLRVSIGEWGGLRVEWTIPIPEGDSHV
ncbi:MAG: histidine kinase [Paenibacillaceae bacterium]|nr:histidine kinase [Paenibacillaceae bacterium]